MSLRVRDEMTLFHHDYFPNTKKYDFSQHKACFLYDSWQEMSGVYYLRIQINACCDHNGNVHPAFASCGRWEDVESLDYSLFINKSFEPQGLPLAKCMQLLKRSACHYLSHVGEMCISCWGARTVGGGKEVKRGEHSRTAHAKRGKRHLCPRLDNKLLCRSGEITSFKRSIKGSTILFCWGFFFFF